MRRNGSLPEKPTSSCATRGAVDHDLVAVRTKRAPVDMPVGLHGVSPQLAGKIVFGEPHSNHAPGKSYGRRSTHHHHHHRPAVIYRTVVEADSERPAWIRDGMRRGSNSVKRSPPTTVVSSGTDSACADTGSGKEATTPATSLLAGFREDRSLGRAAHSPRPRPQLRTPNHVWYQMRPAPVPNVPGGSHAVDRSDEAVGPERYCLLGDSRGQHRVTARATEATASSVIPPTRPPATRSVASDSSYGRSRRRFVDPTALSPVASAVRSVDHRARGRRWHRGAAWWRPGRRFEH